MAYINTSALINTCDLINQRCISIADTYHGSAWLFDKLMRFFESEPSATSITIPVYLNAPLMCNGEATIGRDGSLVMNRKA